MKRRRFSANEAQGGVGIVGGAGGDGTGGAIGLGRIVTAVSTDLELLLPSITISHSTLSVDRLTHKLTRMNHADDAGDNVFGDLS